MIDVEGEGGAAAAITDAPNDIGGQNTYSFTGSDSYSLAITTLDVVTASTFNPSSTTLAIGTVIGGGAPTFAGTATGNTIGAINTTTAVTFSSGGWALTGPGSYTGATTVSGGTLSIPADSSLGTAPGSATANKLVVGGTGANTAVLSANGSFTLNANRGIGLGSTTASTTGSGILDVSSGQTLTYNGIIANAGGGTSVDSLVKTSGGTLALGGNNTYSGTTSVNGGALLLNSGTLSSGPVNVNIGTVLGGAGTINGPVNVNNSVLTGALTIGGATVLTGSASFNPGSANGTGAITINTSLSLGASTASNFYIGGTTLISGSNYTINGNQVLGAGSITYGGSLNVALAAGVSALSLFSSGNTYTFQLFPSGASVSGVFANAGAVASTLNSEYPLSSIDEKWNGFLNNAIQVVPYVPPTTPSYTLTLSPTGTIAAHTGAAFPLAATITNIGGGGNPDSFDYSGLTVNLTSGTGGTIAGPTMNGSGGSIAAGGYGTTSGLTYSNSAVGVYTLATTVGSVTGDNSTTPTFSGPAGSVTLQLYTGQSTWLGGSSARWGDYGNWDGAGGVPGVYSSNPTGDSATFGTTTAGTTTVNLDSATNPSITTLTFSSTTSSYLIAQGLSGGTLTMNGTGAAINVTGNHGISAPLVLASSTSVTTNTSTDTLLLSGVIGDGGSGSGLSIAGPGLVTLAGNNTYLGGTSIAGGATLQVGNGGASGNVSSGAVTNNGTLLLNRSDAALNIPGAISGAGAVTQSGSGTSTLSGSNSYGGGTNVNLGTLEFGQVASQPTSGTVTVAAGAVLAVTANASGGTAGWNSGSIDTLRTAAAPAGALFAAGASLGIDVSAAVGTFTYNSNIGDTSGGSLGLVKRGAGTLVLGGNNTFSGGLTLNGGAVSVSSGVNLGAAAGGITFNGGTLTLTGNNGTYALGTTTVNAASTIGAFNSAGSDGIHATVNIGSITGNGSLTFSTRDSGAINATISGNNTGFSGAISTNSTAGNPPFSLELDGANAGGTGAISFATEYGPAYYLTLKNDSSATFSNSSVSTGGGNSYPLIIDVDKLNSGGSTGQTLTLSSVNMGGGAGGSSISATSSSSDILGITTLNYNTDTNGGRSFTLNAAGASFAIGTINYGSDPLFLSAGNATLGGTIGVITGSPKITVSSGAWTFNGPSTYNAPITISSGTLQFAKEVSLYNNTTAYWTAANITVGSGAMAAFNVGGSGEFTAADISTLAALSTGTANGFTSGSMLGLDTTNAAGGNFAYSSNIANTNGGANVLGLVKLGGNTLTLSGSNTYTGPTIVNAGVLSLASPTSSALGSGAVTISGGTLDASLYSQTVSSLTVGPLGALNLSPTNLFTSNALATLNGTLDVVGAGAAEELMSLPASYSGSFSTTNLPLGYALLYNPQQLDLVAIGATAWSSSISQSWTGPGNWSYGSVPSSGTVSFAVVPGTTAPITVTLDGNQSAGALVFNVSSSNGYTLEQGTSGALTLGTTGSSITVLSGTHSISAPVVLTGSLAISTTGGGALTLAGSVSEATPGTGAIVLSGAGELILSGTGSYTGGTTVNGGTLYMTDTAAIAANTNLTVGAGGTFIFDPNGPGDNVATAASHAASAVEAVPEPGTLALLLAGLCGAMIYGRHRRR